MRGSSGANSVVIGGRNPTLMPDFHSRGGQQHLDTLLTFRE
jgi:hypothetical protein